MNSTVPELVPWAEGGKLPWNDPEFSERMLKEHLSQTHDGASRRLNSINRHAIWLHSAVLHKEPSRILDIGCGPGLYTERLAKFGHHCVGIDYAPASIRYAKEVAAEKKLDCEYIEADITKVDYGSGFHLAYFLYGELNAFKPAIMENVIGRAYAALAPGGRLILEMFESKFLQLLGSRPKSSEQVDSGLFSTKPYHRLTESLFCEDSNATVERNIITHMDSGSISTYVNTLQAYTDKEYHHMLGGAGFTEIKRLPALGGKACAVQQDGLFILYAQKPQSAEPIL